ncbi:MAG TPA: NAD(P)-dependent oxidoreductase [Dehalococcoidales bacterium]|nr:MAG: nucleoside-diphosphate sugar epimerase [Chloroflexi bacterium RBG_16_60_22]HJX13216.1 NAD(P)-dependent oxidoreductase [Dehalococcoidales bacterium]
MSRFSGRRIALVGGAGFIGHHLALKLKELGAEVFVIDSLVVNNYYHFREKKDLIPNADLYLEIIQQRLALLHTGDIPLCEVDARDYHKLSETLTRLDVDAIVHLAAVAHADTSNKDPFSTFDHSLRTLENALDNARSPMLRVRHFVYFSSSMVYGNFPGGHVTEDTPCDPLGIYGALKFAGEKMVIAYNQVFNLPYTILRPSALYGPRCVSRRVGQVFIENALQGLDISIQGDGSGRLDFTYIDDLVSGVVNVLENESSRNEIFNMTYGDSRSVAQMAEILTEHFPGVKIHYVPKDKLTPDRGTLAVDKARKMIGYNPRYPLERGFVEYINWYKSIWESISAAAPQ